MISLEVTTKASCPKCGSQVQRVDCHICGFNILTDKLVSLQYTPKVDLRNINYSEWLRRKNIHVWIKDKR